MDCLGCTLVCLLSCRSIRWAVLPHGPTSQGQLPLPWWWLVSPAGVWVQGVQSSLEVTIAGISVGLLLGPLAGVRLLDTGNASLSPELSSKRKVPYWVVGFDGKWGFSCFYPLGLSCLYVSSRRHISIQILWFSVHTASQRKAPHFLQIIVSKMAPQLYLQKAPKGRPLLLCGAVYNITSGPQGNVATYTPALLWNEFPD